MFYTWIDRRCIFLNVGFEKCFNIFLQQLLGFRCVSSHEVKHGPLLDMIWFFYDTYAFLNVVIFHLFLSVCIEFPNYFEDVLRFLVYLFYDLQILFFLQVVELLSLLLGCHKYWCTELFLFLLWLRLDQFLWVNSRAVGFQKYLNLLIDICQTFLK